MSESVPSGESGIFRISVSKDYLGFAAAHFLTFRGHACESLHGHNYRVSVSVAGPVDPECHFVVDFAVLKQAVRAIVARLDHRVLLPTLNAKLAFRYADDMTLVDYLGAQTYQFPARDCVMLPIPNTTAEMLAAWLGGQLRAALGEAGAAIEWIEVEVEESPGQSARYTAPPTTRQP